ncbi:MAG TPA: M28 family peptidase [Bdellovibrio sp.]|uniref:M28 family peptidase n=1 Tax=Bdellovibrio sp. TaxID=28201 RepID=UPI002EF25E63
MKVSKLFFSTTVLFLFALWVFIFFYLRSPNLVVSGEHSEISVSAATLENDVRFLAGLTPNRSYHHTESMYKAEEFVSDKLKSFGYEVRLQSVDSYKTPFHNIIARYGDPNAKELVVIGAHYDAAGEHNPGADDNASGVAGLLEIARVLMERKPKLRTAIELVVYTLEEPPFFGGHSMGSAYHADQLKADGENVKLMVSLEMIGYFSDEFLSQSFPMPLLYGFYPWTGTFIGVVSSPADRDVTIDFKRSMSRVMEVPVYSVSAPSIMTGIDFSDHRSYWAHEWPALMVTDTAFFRNHEYHEAGDTPDRLNYKKMSDVVTGVYHALINAAGR